MLAKIKTIVSFILLLQDLTAKYEELKQTNDLNNTTMVLELKSDYFKFIIGQVQMRPNLCQSSLENKHEIALSKALTAFEARRNQPNSHGTDVYKSNMIQVGFNLHLLIDLTSCFFLIRMLMLNYIFI